MIYKVNLSNKDSIFISQKELEKFKENISANFIDFDQGLVNPSFVISIIFDAEATREENKRLARDSMRLELAEPKIDIRGTEELKDIIERNRPELLKEN